MARFRLELGPIPLHHQVYLDLRAAMDAGEWRPGDRLPTERDLASRYGCSLITVRRALGELTREQRLERTRGRGTFVLRPRIDRDFAGERSFTEEMQDRGLDPSTRLVAARPESAGEAVANALGLELGSPTLYLERLRMADGEPLLLEQVHLPAERFPGLLASDLERGSLYDLLTERYGVAGGAGPRGPRTRPAAGPRGPTPGPASGHAGIADRRHRIHRGGHAGRVRAGPSCVAIGPATTWSGWWFGRTGSDQTAAGRYRRSARMNWLVARSPGRRGRMDRRNEMERRIGRLTALMASALLIVSACGSTTTSSESPGASVVPASAPAGSPGASVDTTVTPAPTAIAGNASSAKPGDVEVRWYCCLGTGDAPEQVDVEQKVAEDFNASHPGIHLRFEGYPYTLARDSLAVQIGSGSGPDIVGPVGIGGANAFHGQWLDLQPLIDKNHFDMSQFPESTVSLYNVAGEGQAGIPYAIYPSALFYKASLFKEAGLAEPPHAWNSTYKMPDGSTVPVGLRHRPQGRPAADRRQERQGRHGAGLRSGQHRAVGLRAAAR